MMWKRPTNDNVDLDVAETVAHWIRADITPVARALAPLSPRIVTAADTDGLRTPALVVDSDGTPIDLEAWDVVVTSVLPIVVRHAPGVIEVWRCKIEMHKGHHRTARLMKVPVLVNTREGTSTDRIKALLKAIAIQRTKQARRSTICRWCSAPIVSGERYSTYCCIGCANRGDGVIS